MPTTNRRKAKGRRDRETFTALPHHVFRSTPDHRAPASILSKAARCLLTDICHQFNGKNNGSLAVAPKIMAPYGWLSRGSLDDALVELVALGFLEQTRQGGRNKASLFAITWKGIDEGAHHAKPNPVPSNLWTEEKAHLRDTAFVRRWQQCQARRRQNKSASRYPDKLSRSGDKSSFAGLVG